MKDKTVAATSAGVYALSSYYLDRTEVQPKVSKGLSILPIKSIVHYGSNFHQGNAISEEKNNISGTMLRFLCRILKKKKIFSYCVLEKVNMWTTVNAFQTKDSK